MRLSVLPCRRSGYAGMALLCCGLADSSQVGALRCCAVVLSLAVIKGVSCRRYRSFRPLSFDVLPRCGVPRVFAVPLYAVA